MYSRAHIIAEGQEWMGDRISYKLITRGGWKNKTIYNLTSYFKFAFMISLAKNKITKSDIDYVEYI